MPIFGTVGIWIWEKSNVLIEIGKFFTSENDNFKNKTLKKNIIIMVSEIITRFIQGKVSC